MSNEKRLIDANALISAIDEYMKIAYDCPIDEVADFQRTSNDTKATCMVEGLYEATEIIAEAPTVEVVPVVHGRWFDYDNDPMWQECSACGYRIQYSYSKDCKYCPNCGAKMDGERKDNE